MFTGFMAILQALWPFLKESVFGTDTFKEWALNNKLLCAWLLLVTVMFCLVLYLSEMVTTTRHQLEVTSHALDLVKVQYVELKRRTDLLEHDNAGSETTITRLRAKNTELDTKVQTYEGWMARCGMDYHYTGNGPDWPRCAVKVSNDPSSPHRSPRPIHSNEQIIDRLRRWGDKE